MGRVLRVLAIVPIVAGAGTIVFGSNVIQDGGSPAASVESELRFYSAWWVGAGLFLWWLAPQVAERRRALRVFCAVLLLGAFGRVLAIVDAGWPDPFFVVLLGVEVVVAAALLALSGRGSGRTGAGRAWSGGRPGPG